MNVIITSLFSGVAIAAAIIYILKSGFDKAAGIKASEIELKKKLELEEAARREAKEYDIIFERDRKIVEKDFEEAREKFKRDLAREEKIFERNLEAEKQLSSITYAARNYLKYKIIPLIENDNPREIQALLSNFREYTNKIDALLIDNRVYMNSLVFDSAHSFKHYLNGSYSNLVYLLEAYEINDEKEINTLKFVLYSDLGFIDLRFNKILDLLQSFPKHDGDKG